MKYSMGHALSIFGDPSDVMGVRQTGFAMLASAYPATGRSTDTIRDDRATASRNTWTHAFKLLKR